MSQKPSENRITETANVVLGKGMLKEGYEKRGGLYPTPQTPKPTDWVIVGNKKIVSSPTTPNNPASGQSKDSK